MFVYTLYNKENLFSKYQVNLYEFEDRKIFFGGAGLGGLYKDRWLVVLSHIRKPLANLIAAVFSISKSWHVFL